MTYDTIKNIIKCTFIYDVIKQIRWRREAKLWYKKGKPVPLPHFEKQRIVKEYARRFSTSILVETGTYQGDMILATKNIFDKIFSIELNKEFSEQAKKKFAKYAHISIIQGDSSEVLPAILPGITQPCLFWLDAHYSGQNTAKGDIETPIMRELQLILDLSGGEQVILIDDARKFVGQDDYPTLEQLRTFVFQRRRDWVFEVENDIIRIHQKSVI